MGYVITHYDQKMETSYSVHNLVNRDNSEKAATHLTHLEIVLDSALSSATYDNHLIANKASMHDATSDLINSLDLSEETYHQAEAAKAAAPAADTKAAPAADAKAAPAADAKAPATQVKDESAIDQRAISSPGNATVEAQSESAIDARAIKSDDG